MTIRHRDIISRAECAVFVVDVQERFRAHVHAFEEMTARIALLVEAAAVLGVPVAVSEQYPEGLGPTVDEVAEVVPAAAARFEKLEISSVAAPGWDTLPSDVRDARQLVVVGIEAHVCVRQTALDALAAGYEVHVPVDAVSSRGVLERETALRALELAGARTCTVESVLFDWLEVAGSPEFKAVQLLIKSAAATGVR